MSAATMRLRTVALLALLPLLAACQSNPGEPPGWWARRGADLRSSFECAVAFGPGLGARVTATRWLQVGVLAIGPAEGNSRLAPFPQRSVGLRAGELRTETLRTLEYGLSPWYASEAVILDEEGAAPWRGDLAATRETQFAAQVHLGIVGATLGFDPIAFVRLLAGMVGLESGPDEPDPEPN
jgi:hypothetical protein